jgi:hypothetical protein
MFIDAFSLVCIFDSGKVSRWDRPGQATITTFLFLESAAMRKWVGLIVCAALFCAAGSTYGEGFTLLKDDFQAGLGAGESQPGAVGWTKIIGSVNTVNIEPAGAFFTDRQVAMLGEVGGIEPSYMSRTADQTLSGAHQFTLSFDVGTPNGSTGQYYAALYAGDSKVMFTRGDASVGSFTSVSLHFDDALAACSDKPLKVILGSITGSPVAFDNVHLSAVPEPSTLLGLGSMGLMGVALAFRRYRALA